jgi:hypothetical protein
MPTVRLGLTRLGLLCSVAALLPLYQVGGRSGTTRLSPKPAFHTDWGLYASPRAATATYAGLRGNWLQWRARVVLVERRRVRAVSSHITARPLLHGCGCLLCIDALHAVTQVCSCIHLCPAARGGCAGRSVHPGARRAVARRRGRPGRPGLVTVFFTCARTRLTFRCLPGICRYRILWSQRLHHVTMQRVTHQRLLVILLASIFHISTWFCVFRRGQPTPQ